MKEDILDNYALNRLSAKEKAWLEKALEQDPGFQKELDFHAEVIKGMEVHMEQIFDNALVEAKAYADTPLKNTIEAVDKELEQEGFFAIPVQKEEESSLEKELVQNIKQLGEKELHSTIQSVDKELEKEGFFEQSAPTKTIETDKDTESPNTGGNGTPIFGIFKIVAAAASVVLVLTFGWQYMNNNSTAPMALNVSFEHYENGFSKQVALVLTESGFAGNPEEAILTQLSEGMKAYDAKDYTQASQILKTVVSEGITEGEQFQKQAELYLALSYMGNTKNKEALALLQELATGDSSQKEIATWYLASIHINNKNMGLAKVELEKLKSSSIYGERALKLLEQI